jgi:hypothetical protein
VDAIPGVRWIDREQGWFTRDDLMEQSFYYKRVRECLAVAQHPVPAVRLLAALMTLPHQVYRLADRIGAIPVQTFVEVLRGWPGVVVDDTRRVHDAMARVPEELLPRPQVQAYHALAHRGGVARKAVVIDAMGAAVRGTARAQIAQTPWIYSIGHDLYALMGWRITVDAIVAASYAVGPNDVVVVLPGGSTSEASVAGSETHRRCHVDWPSDASEPPPDRGSPVD